MGKIRDETRLYYNRLQSKTKHQLIEKVMVKDSYMRAHEETIKELLEERGKDKRYIQHVKIVLVLLIVLCVIFSSMI